MRNLASLAFLHLAAAAPHVSQLTEHIYDYIVVGGGTGGLVVANRLSELANISVLVIEAGGSILNNPNVTGTSVYGKAFGTPIDWAYKTTAQEYGDGTPQTVRAGKALGGSSTINGLVYLRAQDTQIDAWELIGNKGWNWKNLFPYFRKSEHFQVPTNYAWLDGSGVSYDPEAHGYKGPLKVGWSRNQPNDGLTQKLNATYQNMDTPVPWNNDPNGGQMVGYSVFTKTVDSDLNIREDAARAFYYPYQSRSNLNVWLHTYANKIIWKDEPNVSAEGVEVTFGNGTTTVVKASREVILAAGALKSPALLELSGIGNPE